MKLLVVTTDFPPLTGGISRFSHHVVSHLADRGHEVAVIAPRVSSTASAGKGLETPRWAEVRTPGYDWGLLRGVPMFVALSAQPRPDMVLAMNLGYGGVMSWALRATGLGAPYCVFAYGLEFARHERRPLMRALYGRVLCGAERVFAISTPIRERLLRFCPALPDARVGVVWPGVEATRFAGHARENALRARLGLGTRPTLLSLSRLVPRKGHDRVIEALPAITRRCPDIAYVVVGDGPQRPLLQDLAARLGVAAHVVWAGELTDAELPQAYAMCDVFVLPCREIQGAGDVEGFGIVFAEAGAAARPVIGGDSGGVRDAVIDGVTGLLVDPASSASVAAAVTRLLDDPPLAARLGEGGRRRATELLSWPSVLSPLADFIEAR